MRSPRAGSTISASKCANVKSNVGWSSTRTETNHPKARAMVKSAPSSKRSAYKEAWIPKQELKPKEAQVQIGKPSGSLGKCSRKPNEGMLDSSMVKPVVASLDHEHTPQL